TLFRSHCNRARYITVMRRIGRSPPLFLVTLVTLAITWSAQVSPQQGTREQTEERLAKSTREAMIKLLGSPNANPSIGEEAKSFDRLVGTWDADFAFCRADGSVFHKNVELLLDWVIDSHDMLNICVVYL